MVYSTFQVTCEWTPSKWQFNAVVKQYNVVLFILQYKIVLTFSPDEFYCTLFHEILVTRLFSYFE